MKVFALSDPHLSFGTPNKTMDRFGPQWVGHAQKIAVAWRERVADADVVLVPGDISWAMTLEQARPDLEFLAALPGTKILLKGNHDFWWSTIGKLRAALPAKMLAVQGELVRVGPVAIAGTRLWDDPEVSFASLIDWQPRSGGAGGATAMISAEPRADDREETARLLERELGRLERAMVALQGGTRDAALAIAITHYPPCGADLTPTRATALIEASGARHAVFGHLHALRRDLPKAPFGRRGAVTYTLAACDWIDFVPIEIATV